MDQTVDLQLLQETREAIAVAARNPERVACLLNELHGSQLLAENLLELQDPKERCYIACRPGCDHCCVVNVSVSLVEGMAIVRFLQQLKVADRAKIIVRLDHLWARIRGLDDEERLALRQRCAFLDDRGLCQIYPARPLFCRSVTSIDPETCKRAICCKLQGESQMIMMYQYQQQLYESLYQAFCAGLECSGLDGRSFQMTGIVRYLLNHPADEEAVLQNGCLSWGDIYK